MLKTVVDGPLLRATRLPAPRPTVGQASADRPRSRKPATRARHESSEKGRAGQTGQQQVEPVGACPVFQVGRTSSGDDGDRTVTHVERAGLAPGHMCPGVRPVRDTAVLVDGVAQRGSFARRTGQRRRE